MDPGGEGSLAFAPGAQGGAHSAPEATQKPDVTVLEPGAQPREGWLPAGGWSASLPFLPLPVLTLHVHCKARSELLNVPNQQWPFPGVENR